MLIYAVRLRRDVETLVEIFGQVEWNVGELGRYSSLLEVFGHLNKYEDYDHFKQCGCLKGQCHEIFCFWFFS
jgi:hypothetical protein